MEADGHIAVQEGESIEVMLDRRHHYEGYVSLSHERASNVRAWETLEKAYREGLMISGRVTEKVKGGLNVDVGVAAFMPSSQSDLHVGHNVDSLIGQTCRQSDQDQPTAEQRGGVAQVGDRRGHNGTQIASA